jgi:hypothetical protein
VSPQAQQVEIPKRWPLVTQPENRDDTVDKDAQLVNCYAEKQFDGSYVIQKRPGLSSALYSFSPQGLGVFLWSEILSNGMVPLLIACSSNVSPTSLHSANFKVITQPPGGGYVIVDGGTKNINFGPTVIRSPLTALSVVLYSSTLQFCSIPNPSGPYVIFGTGDGGYYMGGSAGTTATFITDTNFPNFACPGFVYLDGTIYVMDLTGTIFGSKHFNDPRTWDPLNVIQANLETDGGVYLARQLSYVVAIKQWSTQFFYDAGNATGSPLAPVPGALLNYGCKSPDTVQEIDGLLLWVTANRGASSQVILLRDLKHEIVSSPAIDRLLASMNAFGLFAQFRSAVLTRGGHRFYILTMIDANVTLVYDIDQRLWYRWTDENSGWWQIVSRTYDYYGNALFQDAADGHIYKIDLDYVYPNDDGSVVPVDIYTPNFDAGVDRKKQLNVIRFNADQTSGSELFVRSSDNDYQTWTNFRRVDLGNRRPTMTNCGSFYRRAYHFRHFANTALRIKSVDLQMDVGTL